jgi:DNA-directed RNA polymerase subunit beta'
MNNKTIIEKKNVKKVIEKKNNKKIIEKKNVKKIIEKKNNKKIIEKKNVKKKSEKNEDFDYIKINIASPEKIREWGERILPTGQIIGEVTKAETVNYRTLKPEIDGLFCEKIFGPIKNWECNCGKYKGIYNKGLFCDRCDVEITESRVRRHRMGYIDLLTPVTHVWYLKGVPSYLSHMLEQPLKEVEQIVYFNESIEEKIVGLDEYLSNDEDFLLGQEVETGGAEVVYNKLKKIN